MLEPPVPASCWRPTSQLERPQLARCLCFCSPPRGHHELPTNFGRIYLSKHAACGVKQMLQSCLPAGARWQALQQLRAAVQASPPPPSKAAPVMPLWEVLACGAATLLHVSDDESLSLHCTTRILIKVSLRAAIAVTHFVTSAASVRYKLN